MKDITIKEGETVLRTINENDLEIMMNWRNDPEVSDFLCTDTVYTMEGQKKWFEKMKESKDLYLMAEYKGKRFGVGRIVNIDLTNKKCEIGGEIGDLSFRGKGLGKTMFKIMASYCFKELDVNKVSLYVFPFNKVAVHIYESLGFNIDGTLRKDVLKKGKFEDLLVMSILRDQFEQ